MTGQRVLIDIKFTVDKAGIKQAQLSDIVFSSSVVTEAGVRRAVTERIILANWAPQRVAPQRSTITSPIPH